MKMNCPYCSEEILDTAKKCRFCGEWVDDKSKDPLNLSNKHLNFFTLEKKLKYKKLSKIFAIAWFITLVLFLISISLEIDVGVYLPLIAGGLFTVFSLYHLKYKGYEWYYIFRLLLSIIGVIVILSLKDKNPNLK